MNPNVILISLNILLLLSGIFLMLRKTPYNRFVLSMHKLAMVAIIVYVLLTTYFSGMNLWVYGLLAGLLLLLLSGAILSSKNKRIIVWSLMHRFGSLIYYISLVLVLLKI